MPPVHHQEAKVACTYRTVAKRFGGPSKGEWAATMSSERRWLAGQPRACSGRLTPRGEAQHVERKGQETARSRYQPFFRTPQEWPTYQWEAARSNGNGRLTDGKRLLPNRNGRLTDGKRLLPNRNGRLTNGKRLLPNRNGRLTDGKRLPPNRNGRLTDGKRLLPNRNGRLTDGKRRLPNRNGRLTNG